MLNFVISYIITLTFCIREKYAEDGFRLDSVNIYHRLNSLSGVTFIVISLASHTSFSFVL